jgi:DNA-binding transcriptional ArsR family regulator
MGVSMTGSETGSKSISVSPLRMAAGAGEAAVFMKALSNEKRLLILCHLIAEDELSVGELMPKVGLSQSALSQHLSKLRDQGLVTFRRDAQTLFYRMCDARAASMLVQLHQMFCPEPQPPASQKTRMAAAAGPRNKRSKGG